ncbi:hypothetical protein TRVA0_017S01002 [Trichomonascus vanleenenianus]|uniref:E3 ubiquitin-protein ligase RAD18 n=1 Tax=Trichomonascus vanleenenianus TaxID=2268995 RepID=UPI003ECA37E9
MTTQPDLTDPSDWKSTQAPFLTAFETTLTCHICKEFLNAPVITTCCHTFCSLCIRSYLNTEARCPVCRSEIQSSTLRKNMVIEELVDIYRSSRDHLYSTIKRLNGGEYQYSEKTVQTDVVEPESPQNLRRSSRKRQKVTETEVVEVVDDEGDQDYDDVEVLDQVGYGNCPVCGKYMKIKDIETKHIMECLKGGSLLKSGSASSRSPSGSPGKFFKPKEPKEPQEDMTKKIATIAYNLYKEVDLRKLLGRLGVPTTGNKAALQQRHREWMTIWNANADSKKPVSRKVLLAQLRERENILNSSSTKKRPGGGFENIPGYNSKESDFASLIAKARASVKNKGSASESTTDASQLTEGATEASSQPSIKTQADNESS